MYWKVKRARIVSLIVAFSMLFENGIPVYARESDNLDETAVITAEAENMVSPDEPEYVPGEVLVVYDKDISDPQIEETAEEMDSEVIDTIEGDANTVAVVSISDDMTVDEAIEGFVQNPDVAYAEPNYIMESFGSTEQEQYVEDQYVSQQRYLDYVHAQEAWNILQKYDGNQVRVGVIDTGANLEHEDLSEVINAELSVEVVRNTNDNTYTTQRLRGDGYLNGTDEKNSKTVHGTHVAGILAAQSGNGVGIQGVASGGSTGKRNEIVDIVAIDAFPKMDSSGVDGGSVADVIYAMNYAKEQGCKVLNLSLGSSNDSVALKAACESLKEAGITLVCAAGNSNSQEAIYPADYDSTISVININSDGQKHSSSNYGATKDLSAPGTDIYSTISSGNSAYGYQTGTSMAAPIVSAAAAMLLYMDSSLTPDQIKNILCETATDLMDSGKDINTGYGSVNIENALRKAEELIEPEHSESGNENVTYTLQYQSHCQTIGWQQGWKTAGEMAGTTGKNKRMEAIAIKVNQEMPDPENPEEVISEPLEDAIEYRVHCQTHGDMEWVQDGAVAGTVGEKKRMEAIQIRLKGELAEQYDVYYRVYCASFGDMGWAKNGEWAGTSGYAKAIEAITILLVEKGSAEAPEQIGRSYITPTSKGTVTYVSHVQTYGWLDSVADGAMSGTQGKSKRMEALKIYLDNPKDASGQEIEGSIEYQAHAQSYDWMGWKQEGELAGTTGKSKRLEAVQIRLTGAIAELYDVYYRVHCATWGTLGWAKNGETAGTVGFYRSIESIEIKIVEKDSESAPVQSERACLDKSMIGDCTFQAYVDGKGWQDEVGNNEMMGTTGQSKRIEAVKLSLQSGAEGNITEVYSGTIGYKAYMQSTGWQENAWNGNEAGLAGQGKRLEAIQICLTGELAKYCDVYYSAHVQAYGWLGWAKNGQTAGTTNCAYRMEALQIAIVPKTAPAPGANNNYFKNVKKSKLIASFTTECTNTEAGLFNMSKALTSFNGLVVNPGQSVSFFGVAGPCGAAQGYQPAGVVGGMGYGGGICQASTTLYGAVLRAGLGIVERHNHTVPSVYVPIGQDAMVNFGTADFVFRNDLQSPILLVTYVTGRTLHAEIWGADPGWFDNVAVNSWYTGSYSAAAERIFYKNGREVRRDALPKSYYY